MDVDAFAPGLSFFFDSHVDFFEEIAKFRAARRIWATWLRDVYGAKTEKAQWLRFHTQTAGVSLTAQQPYNNVVRTGIEALAAVLGGTNSLHTNALDETLALPPEQAAEIALRTQQVIMEETGVVNVADPLGGSWYVEALIWFHSAGGKRVARPGTRWGTGWGSHALLLRLVPQKPAFPEVRRAVSASDRHLSPSSSGGSRPDHGAGIDLKRSR